MTVKLIKKRLYHIQISYQPLVVVLKTERDVDVTNTSICLGVHIGRLIVVSSRATSLVFHNPWAFIVRRDSHRCTKYTYLRVGSSQFTFRPLSLFSKTPGVILCDVFQSDRISYNTFLPLHDLQSSFRWPHQGVSWMMKHLRRFWQNIPRYIYHIHIVIRPKTYL